MELLRLCIRWLYWRCRAGGKARAPRPLGALARAWVRLWCHPAAALRLDALRRCVKECGRVLGIGGHLDPGPLAGLLGNVGAAHGEIRIGGGITTADLHRSGLWHTGFEAHRRAEALRDSLATLEGQDHSPLSSAALARMLANRNRT
jgi:hypothetical protein